jgi:hypothetical protein
MAVLIAGKRAGFQLAKAFGVNAACKRPREIAADTAASTEQLSLENDAGDRVMFGVAQSDQRRSYTALPRELLRRSRKYEIRLAAFFFLDVDVAPAYCFADACAECFCHRFLSRKTRSQMARREFHRHGILNLTIRKNAMQKAVPESVNGTLNALALDKIDTDADYAHLELPMPTSSACSGAVIPNEVRDPKFDENSH